MTKTLRMALYASGLLFAVSLVFGLASTVTMAGDDASRLVFGRNASTMPPTCPEYPLPVQFGTCGNYSCGAQQIYVCAQLCSIYCECRAAL